MKYLFFIVHPSKFYLFRITINTLLSKGHDVDVCYTSKDVLSHLVGIEEWSEKNLFPRGRKFKRLPAIVNAGIYFFLTVWKLLSYTRGKKYDLYITDDVLGVVGRIRRVPTIHFADDDYSILPASRFLFKYATHILAPASTDLNKFENKKIAFNGYKQSAYLRPEHFKPDPEIFNLFNPKKEKFYLIRLVSLAASHDMGKKGIDDKSLTKLINILEKHGRVFISSERELPLNFQRYKLKIEPSLMLHILHYADIFITDSQTMSLEAGFLGTPFIRFNSFINKISCLEEIENKYNLGFGINSNEVDKLFERVDSLLETENLKVNWLMRRQKMLNDTIDLSAFMIWLFDNYPQSINVLKNTRDFQLTFIKHV